MKAYLHYDAYYEIDMPDINPNTRPWQDVLRDVKRHAESTLDDKWIVEFLETIIED